MVTLEMQRPQRSAPTTSQCSSSLSSTPLCPSSPNIIRTADFILLPSVPTHEPEDNLPCPQTLQQQFALAAQTDAQARRSRQNSIRETNSSEEGARSAFSSCSQLDHYTTSASGHDAGQDELEEIVEPETTVDMDRAASHESLRRLRNQQLDSLQEVVHSIAEAHFDEPTASSQSPNSDTTQMLDDMFASLRRIGGFSAPLSPTFQRSAASPQAMSDVDRLTVLVDRLTSTLGSAASAKEAGLLTRLNSLTQSLVESERRLARAAQDSPPRTPRLLRSDPCYRRRSISQQQNQQQPQHSPLSTSHMSGSRGSWRSFSSHVAASTSSDEAVAGAAVEMQPKSSPVSPTTFKQKRSELLAEAGLLSPVPEQQRVDGSLFDMATIRQASSTTALPASTFSFETLYTQPSTSTVVAPQSPRSDQASRAASVGERSDSTALPNRKRFSVQTESAASTSLPSYTFDSPTYETDGSGSQDKTPPAEKPKATTSDDLPGYDDASMTAEYPTDTKKPLETPTLLERRRAKLAAQHSAYAARTPEDLAMVQSSIDRLSSVMPQLDNQRALSPEEQREAQLQKVIGRLNQSNSRRLNDQRSDAPSFKPSRPAPSPRIELTQNEEKRELPNPSDIEVQHKVVIVEPASEPPVTPSTPASLHSAAGSTSGRRGSLLPTGFGRKLSIASIGNALRRASIYTDTTKGKAREAPEPSSDSTSSRNGTIRPRAATHDSRSKYDIAEGLSSLFNEGKPRKNSADETGSKKSPASGGFRAIDFADDTPRGRDASLNLRSDIEMEDDSMLDDYGFASIDTQKSNHRLSIVSDSARSPINSTGSASHVSSRRSSQMTSHSATPSWPKSPITPISPVATKKSGETMVSFAADTLPPLPVGRATAASTNAQIRDAGLTSLRPGKFPPPTTASRPCDSDPAAAREPVCAPATATTNDLIVYSVRLPTSYAAFNAADSPNPLASSLLQPNVDLQLEFFAEAQPVLGHIHVCFWSSSSSSSNGENVELEYKLIHDVEEHQHQHQSQSHTLLVCPVDPKYSLKVAGAACVRETSGGSGSGSGSGRDADAGAVESAERSIRVRLPAEACFPQSGRVSVALGEGGGAVSRLKLALMDSERRMGAEESRAEGMVEFPLSASHLSSHKVSGLTCSVCARQGRPVGRGLVQAEEGEGVDWRALPSEGWEELVDAWMCHGDQELNRSLTETAVRFSSRLQPDGGGGTLEVRPTIWVGDTYFLLPKSLVQADKVTIQGDHQQIVRCSTCHSKLGEMTASSNDTATSTVKLTKYLVQPLYADCSSTLSSADSASIWLGTLLATLQYAAASHGSRRFLLQPSSSSDRRQGDGIETWLFSRARFTTTLARHWHTVSWNAASTLETVWKGYRIFYRPPQPRMTSDTTDSVDSMDPVDIPAAVYEWTMQAMSECNTWLPLELRQVLPGWNAAYLARRVVE